MRTFSVAHRLAIRVSAVAALCFPISGFQLIGDSDEKLFKAQMRFIRRSRMARSILNKLSSCVLHLFVLIVVHNDTLPVISRI